MKIRNKVHNTWWWFLHRTFYRFHVVDTGLPPGYYDKNTLMLHACFNLLKDYVEGELAWMQLICFDEERKKVKWWQTFKNYRNKNCRELGLKYLSYWDDAQPSENQSLAMIIYQRSNDKEVKDLYLWWVDEYPTRYLKATRYNIEDIDKKEDDMLIRLMKIRQNLWT